MNGEIFFYVEMKNLNKEDLIFVQKKSYLHDGDNFFDEYFNVQFRRRR